jgi:hypothetical protein
MGAVKILLPDEVEHAFRVRAMEEYGYTKGALSEAAAEALRRWLAERAPVAKLAREEGITDPVETLRGLMRGVKKGSVELQHEASRLRAVRYAARRRQRVPRG